jgi:hypothetical protein
VFRERASEGSQFLKSAEKTSVGPASEAGDRGNFSRPIVEELLRVQGERAGADRAGLAQEQSCRAVMLSVRESGAGLSLTIAFGLSRMGFEGPKMERAWITNPNVGSSNWHVEVPLAEARWSSPALHLQYLTAFSQQSMNGFHANRARIDNHLSI